MCIQSNVMCLKHTLTDCHTKKGVGKNSACESERGIDREAEKHMLDIDLLQESWLAI